MDAILNTLSAKHNNNPSIVGLVDMILDFIKVPSAQMAMANDLLLGKLVDNVNHSYEIRYIAHQFEIVSATEAEYDLIILYYAIKKIYNK